MSNNTKATLFAALTIIFSAAGGGYANSRPVHTFGVVIFILLASVSAFMAGYYLSPKLKNK